MEFKNKDYSSFGKQQQVMGLWKFFLRCWGMLRNPGAAERFATQVPGSPTGLDRERRADPPPLPAGWERREGEEAEPERRRWWWRQQ